MCFNLILVTKTMPATHGELLALLLSRATRYFGSGKGWYSYMSGRGFGNDSMWHMISPSSGGG